MRAIVFLVLLMVIGGLVATAVSPRLQQAIFAHEAARQLSRDSSALMQDDALRVAVCGTSAPLPSKARAKACVAVIAGGRIYIVDTGPESVENLLLWNLPLDRVEGVLLTHFHSDHIGDLGELNLQAWAAGRPKPLAVYGGPGVETVVGGFNEAYRLDQGYRTAHHGAAMLPPQAWPLVARPVALVGPPAGKSRRARVLDDGALTITAIELSHGPVTPAYAYRFDYKGRSAVITGDTSAHAPLAAASKGSDVMVAEALARPMIHTLETVAHDSGRERVAKIMHDIQNYHASPAEMANIANEAGVKLLVLYHLLPAPDNLLARRIFTRDMRRARKGDWTMAEDGSLYTLPLGSDAVRIGRVTD